MCYERYLRHHREADESRVMWQDFWRNWWVDEPQAPVEDTEPEPTEVREAVATPER
jgi:hypothetical protein